MTHVLTFIGIAVAGVVVGLGVAFAIFAWTFKDMWGRM